MNLTWIPNAVALHQDTTILQLFIQIFVVFRIDDVWIGIDDGHQEFSVAQK